MNSSKEETKYVLGSVMSNTCRMIGNYLVRNSNGALAKGLSDRFKGISGFVPKIVTTSSP
jgi:hypothetical protein